MKLVLKNNQKNAPIYAVYIYYTVYMPQFWIILIVTVLKKKKEIIWITSPTKRKQKKFDFLHKKIMDFGKNFYVGSQNHVFLYWISDEYVKMHPTVVTSFNSGMC